MAECGLSSQCENASKTAECVLEKGFVQQRLQFIRVTPAIVISQLEVGLARLINLFPTLRAPPPPPLLIYLKYNYRNFEFLVHERSAFCRRKICKSEIKTRRDSLVKN